MCSIELYAKALKVERSERVLKAGTQTVLPEEKNILHPMEKSGCDGRMIIASDSQPHDHGFESRRSHLAHQKASRVRGLRVTAMMLLFTQP